MKVLKARPEACSECYACLDACARARFKSADRKKAALRLEPPGPAGGPVVFTICNQCGECIPYCPARAIYRAKSGVVLIKKEECTGCLSCVAFCPRGAMFAHDDLAEPFKCISCGSCVKACPSGALYLEAPMETPFPPKEGWN